MEQYNSVQQLLKKKEGHKDRKPVFPSTVIQAVFDGKTGASLEAILTQFNSIYIQYQGSPEATRNIIPVEMRRAGLTITYMNMDSETITERATSAVQKDNDHWSLNINWTRVDELSLSGDIAVSANGTWIINGEDTGVKAVGPKGDAGITPWLKTIDNKLHFSYDNVNWEPCSENIAAWFRFKATSSTGLEPSVGKFQISRDNKNWEDLSPEITNALRIAGYVATSSALPGGKPVGTIFGVGPTFAAEDTAHTNPIYRLYVYDGSKWVDNGTFTSIAAGVVQETGNSETLVMSQKATTEKLSELGQKAGGNVTGYASKFQGYLDNSGRVIKLSGYSFAILNVECIAKVTIEATSVFGLLSSFDYASGIYTSASGYSMTGITGNVVVEIPSDAKYLYLLIENDGIARDYNIVAESIRDISIRTVNVQTVEKVIIGGDVLSDAVEYRGYCDNSGKIAKIDGYAFKLVKAEFLPTLLLTIKPTTFTVYGFMASFDYNSGTYTKVEGTDMTTLRASSDIVVPNGCKYVYILTQNDSVQLEVEVTTYPISYLSELINKNTSDIKDFNSELLAINSSITGGDLITSATEYVGYYNGATGKIVKDNAYKFLMIPCNGIKQVKLQASRGVIFAFISSYDYTSSTIDVIDKAHNIRDTEELWSIPTNANFLFIQSVYDNEIVTLKVDAVGLYDMIQQSQGDCNVKKRISIIGDSYSAYKGWNSGEDSSAYYDDADTRNSGITSVTQMWWYQVIKNKGWLFEKCNAWGGTTICNTGYDGEDYSNLSFISDRKDNVGNPDLLFIFGGTNDAWANSPLGEYKYSGWTDDDLKTFRPAVAYLIDYMQLHHPNMEIVVVVNTTINSSYKQSLVTVAQHYGLTCITPSSIEVSSGHPTLQGMSDIANAIINSL